MQFQGPWVFIYDPFDKHPRHGAHGGRCVCHQKGRGGNAVCGQLAAGVEAEPTEPQQRSTQGCQGYARRKHGFLAVSDTFSDDQGQYQTGNGQARGSVEQAQAMLAVLGIDPARLAVAEMQPGDSARFLAAVEQSVQPATAAGS